MYAPSADGDTISSLARRHIYFSGQRRANGKVNTASSAEFLSPNILYPPLAPEAEAATQPHPRDLHRPQCPHRRRGFRSFLSSHKTRRAAISRPPTFACVRQTGGDKPRPYVAALHLPVVAAALGSPRTRETPHPSVALRGMAAATFPQGEGKARRPRRKKKNRGHAALG